MSFLNFSTLAFQLGALIFLSIKLGNWLDYKFQLKPLFCCFVDYFINFFNNLSYYKTIQKIVN